MKTKIFLTSVLAVLFTANIFAQTTKASTIKADIQMTEDRMIRIWFLEAQNEKVSFQIYDQEGTMVMKKSYKCNGNMKLLLDARKMADGNYTIEVSNNNQTLTIKEISLDNGKLSALSTNFNTDDHKLASSN